MKRFIFSVSTFCLLTLILAYAADCIVSRGLQETRHHDFAEWNDIFKGAIQANVLITGSSRACMQIDPAIVDSVLRCNSYNLGLDGHNFYLQYARFQTYLKHNRQPKVIIQILDVFTLEKRKDLFRYEQFLPYFSDSLTAAAIKTYQGFDWLEYNIPFLRYRRKPKFISLGLAEYFHIYHLSASQKYKGYERMDLTWDSSFHNFARTFPKGIPVKVDHESLALFESFLKECQRKKIKTFLVYAPEYQPVHRYFVNRDSIFKIYNALSEKYNAPFLDYSGSTMSARKEFFYNSEHLNGTGSDKFCLELCEDLKKMIPPQTLP